MTDVKLETQKFSSALKAEEVKAQGWIERHPGWTLGIGVVLLLGDVYFAIKAAIH